MPLWHNIGELMDYYVPPMPSVYWVDITRLCNLRCIMCPQSRGLTRREPKMSMDLFRRIVDEVCGERPLLKLYMSGEPFLHDRLFDMIDYAAHRGCQTMIHTNATMLTESVSERLLSSPLMFLSFSFDGCTAQIYEKLRPPAEFHQVRANIMRYFQLRQRNGPGPHSTIEILRMKDTEPFLEEFADEWTERGADDVHVADYMMWQGSIEDRRVDSVTDGAGYNPCAAPFRHGCILSDGTVVPCCMDVDGRMPLGNVNNDRFQDIWSGNGYRQLRLQVLTGSVPPGSMCDGCCNTFRDLA